MSDILDWMYRPDEVNLAEFNAAIHKAYTGRGRSDLWLASCLMQEAGELAEHIIKREGYGKEYTRDQILSEAGDVLNFLTAILHSHGIDLIEAMQDNIIKIRSRGWVK